MATVTLSAKYQVVIPQAVREEMSLTPGEQFRVFRYGDRVELVPVRPMSALRGSLPGLDTDLTRDGDRS
ncbi:MAG: AbrB/MazE/SpoVT family DNA-binding domain-containing protein [Armatimonadetes bacterium]|nr:AbrB/MazE/SpoVT family DNA-binding domain-containing protein [Armatimonadota bacterium]